MGRLSVIVILMLALGGCADASGARAGLVGPPENAKAREQIHWVPIMEASGSTRLLYTRICLPASGLPARIVVLGHGAPADANVRPGMQPASCDNEAVRWFVSRGFVVAASMRRGYGQTGGTYVESAGQCSAEEYARSARESARDIAATIAYATHLPYARAENVIVVGQSAGGWAAGGLNSMPHPHVVAMVSMAGGRGGHVNNVPNHNCRPDQMVRAAGLLAASATTPMLWIYTDNDSYFSPDLAAAMHIQFTRAGGKAELAQLGPFGSDGHNLFYGRGGSAIWGPLVERYLAGRPGGL